MIQVTSASNRKSPKNTANSYRTASYTIDWSQSQAEITIDDDDPQSVWFDNSMSLTVAENDSLSLTLFRDTTEGDLTVSFQAVNQSAEAGDYTLSPTNSITFSAGSSSTMIMLTAEDDADADDEAVSIELVAPGDGSYAPGMYAWVTIEDREPPIPADLYYLTAQGTALSGNLLTDDTGEGMNGDPNGDQLNVDGTVLSSPSNGTLSISTNGDFTYTPDVSFTGVVSFSYLIFDPYGASALALAHVEVYGVDKRDEAALQAKIVKDDENDLDEFNHVPQQNDEDEYLPEGIEDGTNTGAYVPFNNDDDDDDGELDFRETNATTGENDLLPITVFPGNLADGFLRLSANGGLIIWQDAERTTPLAGPLNVEADFGTEHKLDLFVEAVSGTTGLRTIRLDWGPNPTTQNQFVDRMNIRTFKFIGPTNVPGDSKYEYKAEGGIAGNQSNWVQLPAGQGQITINGDSADIQWGAGPFIGKARYQPSQEYIWARDVNVVEIQFGTGAQQHVIQTTVVFQSKWDSRQVSQGGLFCGGVTPERKRP